LNGAESLVRTAVASGVEICFANPGTTEMPLVAALDSVAGLRAVLGLFEGVCTGAADGWARMTGRPAMTLLHLGPGLANGLSNLHNARRARAPVLNVIGDHATWHAAADAPLACDVESLASPMSCFVRTSRTAGEVARDTRDALAAARATPGGVATLIVPADCQWETSDAPVRAAPAAAPHAASVAAVERAAVALRESAPAALLLGGAALSVRGLEAAARVAAATGARLLCDGFPARLERGAGRPAVERFPYFPEQGVELLRAHPALVLAGAREPVAFFGYAGQPSRLTPESCALHTLATLDEDPVASLEALAGALDAPAGPVARAPLSLPGPCAGPLSPRAIAEVVSRLLPENAIVVDEAITSGLPCFLVTSTAPPHTWLSLTGGSLGLGLPCAAGAALACPDRKVIALQADGSAMYTLQALWTQVREGLDVVNLVFANRRYAILQIELARAGIAEPGPAARRMTQLEGPALDWTALASGMGLRASRATQAEELATALGRALAEPGPCLIEMVF
jgi:acetolactate synthase-1/2/3 large subunit